MLTLNEETGEIQWNSPKKPGQYNIAIRINEYRCGELISSIVRDMAILIEECDNNPPIIILTDEVCATAVDLLNIPVLVDDTERDSPLVKLSANGGPFLQDISPAIFTGSNSYENVPMTADFIW